MKGERIWQDEHVEVAAAAETFFGRLRKRFAFPRAAL